MGINTVNKQEILDQIDRFPESPGVYIMKDVEGIPIYIGKAINLKSRVRSYFSDTHTDRAHIPVMLQRLHHIDWIATNNETEALILEANLIRTHKPKFNIDLKDDKHYPYLKITVNEPFPRLLVVRKVEKDGAKYFGPYTDAKAMRHVASFAKKIFKIRVCNRILPLPKPVRPCINYSMKHCPGACAWKISEEDYRRNVNDLIRFLSGKRNDLLNELQERMDLAAQELRYEDAAMIRDQIQLIKDASRLQQVDLKLTDTDTDVFGICTGDRHICLAILHFRNGLLIANRHFLIRRNTWELSNLSHDNVILQFYLSQEQEPPEEILIPENAGFNQETLQLWFNQQFTSMKITVSIPQKGIKHQLIHMAEKNAKLYLLQKIPPNALEDCQDLQKVLQLPKLPEVIEAFDISNLGESFTVAGMVQFKEGIPNKSEYRRYKIKSVDGQNDFAMMMEVVSRRLHRLNEEQKPFPDLLLIDGGKGQLHAAMESMKEFENAPLIISLAKKEEILFSPFLEEPVCLPPTHPARRLVQRIRDEVHRFAITYHRTLRGKQFKRSQLQDLQGIGNKKALALLRYFGSVYRLKEASPEEIAQVEGFSMGSALKLKEALAKYDPTPVNRNKHTKK